MSNRTDCHAPLTERPALLSSVVRHIPLALPLILSAAALAATLVPEGTIPQAGAAQAPETAMIAPLIASEDAVLSAALATWDRLRRDDNGSFEDYAAFLMAHPGWPGEARMRKLAESKADPLLVSPRLVVDFFSRFPAQGATARARHSEALALIGRLPEALDAARAAWVSGAIAPLDESRLLGRFGTRFTQTEQDIRMEQLLAQQSTTAAARQITLVSPARRPVYEARLALQTKRTDAQVLADALGPAAVNDPGFVLDKARWLRDTAQPFAARQLLAQPLPFAAPPSDSGKWIDMLLDLARGAQADGQPQLAYGLALNADRAFVPGTDVSREAFDLRDDYTSLVWIGAQAALRRLERPLDAAVLFDRYARAARTPQTRAKGWYWAGRALLRAGDTIGANRHFASAAAYRDQFYGQLAAERVGVGPPLPSLVTPPAPTLAERSAFQGQALVKAARILGQRGQWKDQTLFIRAIAQRVESDADQAMAAELARTIQRPDLGVMIARNLRNSGGQNLVSMGFPALDLSPPLLNRHWTMIHAITRQESQFDRQIVSHAGARGLMQLMPGTAQETAIKLGLPFDPARLTSDPDYNVMLGSAFFARLLDNYGGNHVLAVAAYNAGPGNVRKWLVANGDPRDPAVDVIDWIEAIPFTETRGYVQRVLENAVIYDMLKPGGASAGSSRLSAYLGKSTPG